MASKTEAPVAGSKKAAILKFLDKWTVLLAIVLCILFFSLNPVTNSTFPTFDNMITILRAVAVTTVLACGVTVTLACGGFDLSSGATATVAGAFIISFYVWYNMSSVLAIPLTFICTMLCYSVTIFLIVVCKIPDLLATCAMMFTFQGLSLTYSGGGAISQGMPRADGTPTDGRIPQFFKQLGMAPWIIIIMFVVVILVHIFLTYTKYGRYIYACGGNREAARLSGIPVKKYRVLSGYITAFLFTLAGLLVASRNNSSQINGADSYGMPAIAACYIGFSVAGAGKANAFGTCVGAILVGILENGLVQMSCPYYALNMVKGIVLAIALASTYAKIKEN